MSTPSADSIRAELEKNQKRVLHLDPIVIAYFGDLTIGLKGVLEKKVHNLTLDNPPHCIDQSKPKSGPVGSCT